MVHASYNHFFVPPPIEGVLSSAAGLTEQIGDIGVALLSHAGDVGADLLVMGSWGHGPWRERLLGGVTRTVLANMRVPVITSH